VGAHRAGSTTVQRLLANRREELEARGILPFVRARIQTEPLLRPLLRLAEFPAGVLLPAASLMNERSAALVVSEENMLGKMPGHRDAAFYPEHANAIAALRSLANGFDLSVRWIVRRQDAFLESIYSFRVSRGVTADFETFSRDLVDKLHWLPIVRALADEAPYDLRIGVFESVFGAGSDAALLRFLDLPLAASSGRLRAQNSGLRGPMLHVVRFVNLRAPQHARFERNKMVNTLAATGKRGQLPTAAELAAAFERAGMQDFVKLAPAALDFAARAPLPSLDDAGRRQLLARYAEENRALFAMSCVEGRPADWQLG
jgi:hypothetical protein